MNHGRSLTYVLSSRRLSAQDRYYSFTPLTVMPRKVIKAAKRKSWSQSWNRCPAQGLRCFSTRYPSATGAKAGAKAGYSQISRAKGPQNYSARYPPLRLTCAKPSIQELYRYYRDAINSKVYHFLWNFSKFLQKTGTKNPELSVTLAKFMQPFWEGDTRYHSIQQPGVRRRVPLQALEKLEEMFCVVYCVRDKYLPTVTRMRRQRLDNIDPNTDFSCQELEQILSEWRQEYVMWMPEKSKKRYEKLLQHNRKGPQQKARQLLQKEHDEYQINVAGSVGNIPFLRHLIQYPSQTDPANLLPWMKSQTRR